MLARSDWSVMNGHPVERPRSWEYYDRRAFEGTRTIDHALAYWTRLGVEATAADIEVEAVEVRRLLGSMLPIPFVEVGAGPGTFTLTCRDGESLSIRARPRCEFFGQVTPTPLLFGETLFAYR